MLVECLINVNVIGYIYEWLNCNGIVGILFIGEAAMIYKGKIMTDPAIMLGKPIIKGTRITVEHVLRKLSEGMTVEELLEVYPHLTKEDILAALSYSADVIELEELIAT
ncbi:DUF433 domain-containing protein [Candidatus Kuenenia sp.]|uniref:DUF433 domain-containing protein n=1 Tax=Candidatus Kuenenia sp. TaxID=2499824 RepID=UPI003220078E